MEEGEKVEEEVGGRKEDGERVTDLTRERSRSRDREGVRDGRALAPDRGGCGREDRFIVMAGNVEGVTSLSWWSISFPTALPID